MKVILFLLVSYLLGSVPFGLLLARLKGRDPRLEGSGNIGATNVLRVAGKTLGLLTLLFDTAKGFFPVLLASKMGGDPWTVAACGLAAFVGHLYPIYLRFRGGKGVAVALGVFLAIGPFFVFLTTVFFFLLLYLFRYVSLASICSSWFFSLVLLLFRAPETSLLLSLIVAALITFRHKANIDRLLRGKEHKIFLKGGA